MTNGTGGGTGGKIRRITEGFVKGKITEGSVKKGGVKPVPVSPKPDIKPVGQNPPSNKNK
jgi:hypothetical protein